MNDNNNDVSVIHSVLHNESVEEAILDSVNVGGGNLNAEGQRVKRYNGYSVAVNNYTLCKITLAMSREGICTVTEAQIERVKGWVRSLADFECEELKECPVAVDADSVCVGLWVEKIYNGDDSKAILHVDYSAHVLHREDAVKIGVFFNQKAIWNNAEGEEVDLTPYYPKGGSAFTFMEAVEICRPTHGELELPRDES